MGGKFYRPVESYQDPEWIKKISKHLKDPKHRKIVSESNKRRSKDPEYRKKMIRHLSKYRNTRRDPVTGRYIKKNVQAKEK